MLTPEMIAELRERGADRQLRADLRAVRRLSRDRFWRNDAPDIAGWLAFNQAFNELRGEARRPFRPIRDEGCVR